MSTAGRPGVRLGEIAARLPERAPEAGEEFSAILADLAPRRRVTVH